MRHWLARVRDRAGNGRVMRFARHEGATTAIEFAFVAPVFLAFLLATLQITVIFLAQSYLAAITDATERQVLTNKTATLTAAQWTTLMCSETTALFNCNNYIVSLQNAPNTPAGITSALPTFNASGALASTPPIASITPSQQGTKVLLVVMYQWPVIAGPLGTGTLGTYFGMLPNGNFLLSSTEVFQTEPCTNSCT
jgi:Flp pilus assembly protein TadG